MTCRVYLITPPKLELPAFAETLKRALEAGDVASVQLRLKDVSDDAVREAAMAWDGSDPIRHEWPQG